MAITDHKRLIDELGKRNTIPEYPGQTGVKLCRILRANIE
jgi:hypothetical protein